MKRHFAHPNPRFGTKNRPLGPAAWGESIYYLWFEYLRRNEDYRRTCENGGKGKCANIYRDFGDVRQDFKTWWRTNDRGATLFAEPHEQSIEVLTDAAALPATRDRTLVLTIPLEMPSTYLVKRFKEILDKHHAGKQGVKVNTTSKSKALYPTTTDRIAIDFLKKALEVWDARQAYPEKSYVELALDLKLSPNNHIKLDKAGKIPRGRHVANEKNILRATLGRYLRKADAAIANTALGRFPDYTQAKSKAAKANK
jgi:hypothetical protein